MDKSLSSKVEETEGIILDLCEVLDENDTEKTVENIMRMHAEIEAVYEKKLLKLQELIDGMICLF